MFGRLVLPWRRVFLALLLATVASPASAQTAPADKALLHVNLPAEAVLVIGSSGTEQTGADRLFVSPPLTPGKKYVYKLTATWKVKGEPVTVVKEIDVSAGVVTRVDFPESDWLTQAQPHTEQKPKSRTFAFTYAATVTGLKPGEAARVWLPVPPDNGEQKIVILTPLKDAKLTTEAGYGNRMYYLEAKADAEGKIPLEMAFIVTRNEVLDPLTKDTAEDAAKLARLLQPDKLVPIDGKPLELLKGQELPKDEMAKAKILYDIVNKHMKYNKDGTGWGRGDSVWACENGYGNCTDFHSLFISLARAEKIPAKFEIGFELPPMDDEGDIGGYHCWAKFHVAGKGWVAVDISEANKNPMQAQYYFGNLTADRVTFSTGRDLTLEPKQNAGPVNFLVYPYVEVDGKAYQQAKIVRKFSFKDVK